MITLHRLPLRAALPLFFAVGAGALILEITWMRWLRALMGATAPAVSAALVALALGQLIGALLGGRIASRTRAPIRAFGSVLIVAAVFALFVQPLLSAGGLLVDAVQTSSFVARTLVRLGASVAATLPASAAIGALFPLLIASTSERAGDLGANGTVLYAVDLLGAAIGAGLAAFWLPAALGVRGAYSVGVFVLGVAGIVSLVAARRRTSAVGRQADGDAPASWPRLEFGLVSAASGFGVFSAQLMFHQAFGRVLDQSTFALGAVLVTTLLSLAVGAAVIAWLQAKVRARVLLAVSGAIAAVGFAWFPAAFTAATDGLSYVVSSGPSASYVPRAIALCALTAGPTLVAAAAVFPSLLVLVGGHRSGDGRVAGHLAGALLATNTVGAIAGALAAPYLLLPKVGLWPSFLCVGIIYAFVAVGAARKARHAWAGTIALTAVLAFGTPWRVSPVRLAEGDTLVDTQTSAQGLVAVVERHGQRFIQTDNHYILGGTADSTHQERQGHLPLLLHPAPRRVAFIGTATGSSAGAALSHEIDQLVTVEIMPGVTEAAREYFKDANAGVFDDPRTDVVVDDARSFLRRKGEPFDVIVGDLFVPWRSETGSLYSREHFERAKSRLAPEGFFCQWLPLYQLSPAELDSIMATFLDVFPDAEVFRGDFFGQYGIIALIGGSGPPDLTGAMERATRLRDGGIEDRWVTHRLGIPALYLGPLSALSERLANVPRNTLDQPVVEFAAARNSARHQGGTSWTAAGESFLDMSKSLRQGALRSGAMTADAQRAAKGGDALQAASTYWTLDRTEEAGAALFEASTSLPPVLFSEAPPDPTAADVWHVGPSH